MTTQQRGSTTWTAAQLDVLDAAREAMDALDRRYGACMEANARLRHALLAAGAVIREAVEARDAFAAGEAHVKALNDRADWLYRQSQAEPDNDELRARRQQHLAQCTSYAETHAQARRRKGAAEAALRAHAAKMGGTS